MDNYTIFDYLWEILFVNPLALIGVILITAYILPFKLSWRRKIAILLPALLLFYYLQIGLTHIFGITTVGQLQRMLRLGEGVFHPRWEWRLLSEGLSSGFIANIMIFMPIGFLLPFISRSFQKVYKTVFLGAGISLAIEISQIFTLYRATDINDLLANTIGTLIGWCCFKLVAKIFRLQATVEVQTRFLPVIVVVIAFLNVFLNV